MTGSGSAATADAARLDLDAAAKLSALRRTKFIATAALALCVLVFALAKSFQRSLSVAGFRCRLRRGGDHRRPCRLVRGGGAVQAAARPADPAHRHHPGKPEPHRRQSRPLHRGQFPGAGTGAGKAGRGRFCRARRRLADRCRTRRRPVALRRAAGAADAGGGRAIRPARLRHQPHAGADRKGAAGAAGRRTACRRSPTTAVTRSCSTNSPRWSAGS